MRKAISILSASAIALGTCLPAIAFADPDPASPPNVGGQSGAGSTDMTMVWQNPNQEYGGTEDPNNPNSTGDSGDDGYDATAPGENLAFKVPTAINYVAKADGTLLAPSAGSIHIDNYSAFGIRVSSMKIDPNTTDGWNIVADSTAATNTPNAVWGTIGPDSDPLNWASYVPVSPSTDPIPVSSEAAWNMAAKDNTGDSLGLLAAGNVANLNIDLSTSKTFGTIHWYLKSGNADGTPATPDVTIKDGFNGNVVTTMSMSQLLSDAAAVANDDAWTTHADAANNYANPDTSTTTGLYASYMMGDYSFSFAGDANSEPMEYRIIGLNHSPADGESGLTFMAKRSLDKGYFMREDIDVQNSWGASEYSWRDTAMRKELNPEVDNGQTAGSGQVYSLIPQLVRDSAPVIKKHNNAVIENWNLSADTYDRFWLISPMEFWGEDSYGDYEGDNNGQYEFFAAHGIAPHTDSPIFENMAYTMSGEHFADGVPPEIEHNAEDGWAPWGWMRTVYTTEFQTFVRFMDSYSASFSAANATWGVHPCFNLGGTNQIPSSAPALPSSKAAVATTSLSDLHAIGDYITLGWASPAYIAEAESLVGATIEVELANGSTMEARLADISPSHGLTFEATGALAQSVMETAEKNTVKWNESYLRTSMNEAAGELYTTYFMGTDLDAVVRPVTTISLVYNTWKVPSANDRYWIPSMDNIYGPGWFDYDGGAGSSDDEWQFDYYRTMVPALDSNESDVRLVKELNGSPVDWGLRSACPPDGADAYVAFYENSPTSYYLAVEEIGVVPCFCL